MYTDDRDRMRQSFVDIRQRQQAGTPLSPVEQLVAAVIDEHPEYHGLLESGRIGSEFPPELGETNPFLHMGMHIALKEQVSTGNPPGILSVYKDLCKRLDEAHEVEHRMMECLAEALWQAQRSGGMPDESAYLDCLKKLTKSRMA